MLCQFMAFVDQSLDSICLFVCFFFLGLHSRHMEVPRLGVESELKPLAYTTATATWDPSCVCDPHHCSPQCQILNPLREARDRTGILMDPRQVLTCPQREPLGFSYRCYCLVGIFCEATEIWDLLLCHLAFEIKIMVLIQIRYNSLPTQSKMKKKIKASSLTEEELLVNIEAGKDC